MNLLSAKDFWKSLCGVIYKKQNWVCLIAQLPQLYFLWKWCKNATACEKSARRCNIFAVSKRFLKIIGLCNLQKELMLFNCTVTATLLSAKMYKNTTACLKISTIRFAILFARGFSRKFTKRKSRETVRWVKTVADLFGMWRNLCRKSKQCCSFYLKKVAQKQKLWYTSKAICVKKVSLRLQMEVEQCSTLFYCLPTRRMWCLELKLLLRWLLLFVRCLSFALSSCNRATATVWKPSAALPNPTIPKRTTAKTHLPVVMQNLNSGHTSAREFWQFAVLCSSFFPYCKRKRVEQLSNSIALFFVPKRFEKALFNVRDCADNVMQICH